MKKQIWLRPDQVDLVVSCLKYFRNRCTEPNNLESAAAYTAKGYTIRRVDEVLALLEQRTDVQPVKVR